MTIQDVSCIDALLPQTQCTRCGYPTCRAYADAIARDEADIDRCAPGGAEGVTALAQLLSRQPKPLNPQYGVEAVPTVAVIDEDVCIGCTKCIQACPFDAIVGSAKRMHTVIAAECTGCELCLPPCPVDCIAMVPIGPDPLPRDRILQRAKHARGRFEARQSRLVGPTWGSRTGATRELNAMPATPATAGTASSETPRRISRAEVLDAIARGKARRTASKDPATR